MKSATKVLILLLCVGICTGGAFLSVRGNAKASRPKTNIVPIDNREPQPGGWIWA